MATRLLLLLLVTTQLVSWSAAPLYLCVARCGSVCIDRGSENCGCNEKSHRQAQIGHPLCDQCREHEEHGDNEPEIAGHVHSVFNDCDCTHIQILHRQGPVVVRGLARAGDMQPADSISAPDGGSLVEYALWKSSAGLNRPRQLAAPRLVLLMLATVVRQC